MQILVFDTSLDKTYITLGLQNTNTETTTFVSTKIRSTQKKYHSAYLISQINKILEDNLIDIKNVDAIGVNVGPGSFTGIRVCLTVAKVMAQQLHIRLIGVSSCEILSKVFVNANNKIYPVIMDARRGMYYCYNPIKTKKIQLLKKDEIEEFFDNIKEDKKIITDLNSKEMMKDFGFEPVSFEESNFPLGDILAEITFARLKTIRSASECHWSIVKPLYIQTPPVLG